MGVLRRSRPGRRTQHRQSRSPWSPAATIVAVMLVVTTQPTDCSGQDAAIVGSWQVDIDCGLFPFEYATATSFLLIEESVDGQGLVATIPSCGTLAVPGGLEEMVQCVTEPDPIPVGFDGGESVAIPPEGFFASVSMPEEPFPFPLVGCAEVGVISASLRYEGFPTHDENGAVVKIDGALENGPLDIQDSAGRTCFGLPATIACLFEMRRNDVSPGTHVTVEPRSGARLTFPEVHTAGTAAVVPLTELEGGFPPGFQVVGDTVEVVFDVTTTAEFSGPVTLCVAYLDHDDDGFVDGTDPPVPELNVRLLHEEGGTFVDRTVSRDAAANEVCSETAGLSQFALGGSEATPVPPPPRRRIALSRGGVGGRLPVRRSPRHR